MPARVVNEGGKDKFVAPCFGFLIHSELIEVKQVSLNAPDCVTDSPFWLIWCEFTGFRLCTCACDLRDYMIQIQRSTMKLKVEGEMLYLFTISFFYWCE